MGRIRNVGAAQTGKICERLSKDDAYYKSLYDIYNPFRHSLPSISCLALIEKFENSPALIQELLKSDGKKFKTLLDGQFGAGRKPSGDYNNAGHSKTKKKLKERNVTKTEPETIVDSIDWESFRLAMGVDDSEATKEAQPEPESSDVTVEVDEESTDSLHRLVRTDLIRKSMSESPVVWKTVAQLRTLSEKHYSAICGCIMKAKQKKKSLRSSKSQESPKMINISPKKRRSFCEVPKEVEDVAPVVDVLPVKKKRGRPRKSELLSPSSCSIDNASATTLGDVSDSLTKSHLEGSSLTATPSVSESGEQKKTKKKKTPQSGGFAGKGSKPKLFSTPVSRALMKKSLGRSCKPQIDKLTDRTEKCSAEKVVIQDEAGLLNASDSAVNESTTKEDISQSEVSQEARRQRGGHFMTNTREGGKRQVHPNRKYFDAEESPSEKTDRRQRSTSERKQRTPKANGYGVKDEDTSSPSGRRHRTVSQASSSRPKKGPSSDSEAALESISSDEDAAVSIETGEVERPPGSSDIVCAKCGCDATSGSKNPSSTPGASDVALCFKCTNRLTNFLRSVRRHEDCACIQPDQCLFRSNTPWLCKPCKFQQFADLAFDMTKLVGHRSSSIQVLRQLNITQLRSPKMVHRARELRCSEYKSCLEKRRSQLPRPEFPHESRSPCKLVEGEGPKGLDTKFDFDPKMVKLLPKSVPFACDICEVTSGGVGDPSFYMVDASSYVCEPCIRRCQSLIRTPPPQEDKDGKHDTCKGSKRCDLCFFTESQSRLPLAALWCPVPSEATPSLAGVESNGNADQAAADGSLFSRRIENPAGLECSVCRTSWDLIKGDRSVGSSPDKWALSFYRLEGGVVVCEYCTWVYKAKTSEVKNWEALKCDKGGICDPLSCSKCLVGRCKQCIPLDASLALPGWLVHPGSEETEKSMQGSRSPVKVNGKGRGQSPKKSSEGRPSVNPRKLRLKIPTGGEDDGQSFLTPSVPKRRKSGNVNGPANKSRTGPRVKQVSRDGNSLVGNGSGSDFIAVLSSSGESGSELSGAEEVLPPCGKCPGCTTLHDCGLCKHCRLKAKYGEKAFSKKCLDRMCMRIKSAGSTVGRKTGARVKHPLASERAPARKRDDFGIAARASFLTSQANADADDELLVGENLDEVEEPDRIKAAEGEVIDSNLAHDGGYPVVTTAAAAPPKEICYSCASGGGQLLFCVSCAEPFHFYCIDRQFRPKKKDHFVCRNCTLCCRCKGAGSDLKCIKCRSGYHPACCKDYPPTKAIDRSSWICPDCTICTHCNKTPAEADGWSAELYVCAPCQDALERGDECPECGRAYHDDTTQMIECDDCRRWIHRQCAKLNNDQYEILAHMPSASLKKLSFHCKQCRPKNPRCDDEEGLENTSSENHPLRALAQSTLLERMSSLLTGLESEERVLVSQQSRDEGSGDKEREIPQLDGVLDEDCADVWENSSTDAGQDTFSPKETDTSPSNLDFSVKDYPSRMASESPGTRVEEYPETTREPVEDALTEVELAKLIIKVQDYKFRTVSELLQSVLARLLSQIQSASWVTSASLTYSHLQCKLEEQAAHLFPWLTVAEIVEDVRALLRQYNGNLATTLHAIEAQALTEMEEEETNTIPIWKLDDERLEALDKEDELWINHWSQIEEDEVISRALLHSNAGDDWEGVEEAEGEEVDPRHCVLCGVTGDLGVEGRLLYCGQDAWVHVNCALWSNEVYEEENGLIMHLAQALQRGRTTRCSHCQRRGATLTCCLPDKECTMTTHFRCALRSGGKFTDSRTVFCSERHAKKAQHVSFLSAEDLLICRRVMVASDCYNQTSTKGEPSPFLEGLKAQDIIVTIGALRIESLGKLKEASDSMGFLLCPSEFRCRRFYWSRDSLDERQAYSLRVKQVRWTCHPKGMTTDASQRPPWSNLSKSGIDPLEMFGPQPPKRPHLLQGLPNTLRTGIPQIDPRREVVNNHVTPSSSAITIHVPTSSNMSRVVNQGSATQTLFVRHIPMKRSATSAGIEPALNPIKRIRVLPQPGSRLQPTLRAIPIYPVTSNGVISATPLRLVPSTSQSGGLHFMRPVTSSQQKPHPNVLPTHDPCLGADLDNLLQSIISKKVAQAAASNTPQIPQRLNGSSVTLNLSVTNVPSDKNGVDNVVINAEVCKEESIPQLDGNADRANDTLPRRKKSRHGVPDKEVPPSQAIQNKTRKKRWMEEKEKQRRLTMQIDKAKKQNHDRQYRKEAEVYANHFVLRFMVDGIAKGCTTPEGAWRCVTDGVRRLRKQHGLPSMIPRILDDGWVQFGLSHRHVIYLAEQMSGAFHCFRYKFHYHKRRIERLRELFTPPVPCPSGCARSEGYKLPPRPQHLARDPLNFLSCKANFPPRPKLPRSAGEESIPPEVGPATMAAQFRQLISGSEARSVNVGVFRSSIHYRGLFALREFAPDEMVSEYLGELVRCSLSDVREKHYRRAGVDCYMFKLDEHYVIDATMKGNAARFINHSCEPNCHARVVRVDGVQHIVIFSRRRIFPGEELTYDYQFPKEDDDKVHCNCGTAGCRKFLN